MKKQHSLLFLPLLFAVVLQAQELSNEDILRKADFATGANIDGLHFLVTIVSTDKNGDVERQTLDIKSTHDNWVAETQLPPRARGRKMLMINRNMWFTKPDLRKPVPISMRQRLSGGASNGDIASTNYAEDYRATRLADAVVDGHLCYVFDLAAKEKNVTYDQVKYWIRQVDGLGQKAEFYSRSGKLLKTAEFQFDNRITAENHQLPFLSQMVIRDTLSGDISELRYTDVKVAPISAASFRL